jgi:serine/threonine-protein kinase
MTACPRQDAEVGAVVESGRVLAGRYRLVARLDRGGFGEVWRASDPLLGRDVAVKTLTFAPRDQAGVKRFAREARALARLNHPNVVAVYDSGLDDATGYLVMPLLAGPSLATLLAEKGPLPLEEAVDYAKQAAAGLEAAHKADLVHRDVSPANLILDGAGTLKLVDFGVARFADASTALTATGTVFATPGYVSPEQAAGRPADARSDLYALGCVLYALLAGSPPFTAEHPIGVVQHHLTSPPPSLGARRADVPTALDDLLTALLAKDPRDRPQTAREVAQRLAAMRPQTGATVPLTAPTLVLRRAPRRRWWLWACGALALLGIGGVLAIALGENDHSAAPAPTTAAAPRPQPSTTAAPPPATTSPPPTTTAAASPPTTTAAAAPPPAPADPVAAALSAISTAVAAGQLDPGAAADLEHHLTDVGHGRDAAKKLDDLSRRLDHLVRKGQLSPAAYDQISAAINELASQAPGANDSPQQPQGQNSGNDESND